MSASTEDVDLERELLDEFVKEVVNVALASPLREPILEAVEDVSEESGGEPPVAEESEDEPPAADEEPTDDEGEAEIETIAPKSNLVKAIQGLAVFVTMFVVLYVVLRRLTDDAAS